MSRIPACDRPSTGQPGRAARIIRYPRGRPCQDETRTRAAIAVSGPRSWSGTSLLVAGRIGTFDTELVREFFQALAQNAGITLHSNHPHGANTTILPTGFKQVGVARVQTLERDRATGAVPSTKGLEGKAEWPANVVMNRRPWRRRPTRRRPLSATAFPGWLSGGAAVASPGTGFG